jgi:hypothetical protein
MESLATGLRLAGAIAKLNSFTNVRPFTFGWMDQNSFWKSRHRNNNFGINFRVSRHDPRRTDAPRALAGTAQGARWREEAEAR